MAETQFGHASCPHGVESGHGPGPHSLAIFREGRTRRGEKRLRPSFAQMEERHPIASSKSTRCHHRFAGAARPDEPERSPRQGLRRARGRPASHRARAPFRGGLAAAPARPAAAAPGSRRTPRRSPEGSSPTPVGPFSGRSSPQDAPFVRSSVPRHARAQSPWARSVADKPKQLLTTPALVEAITRLCLIWVASGH